MQREDGDVVQHTAYTSIQGLVPSLGAELGALSTLGFAGRGVQKGDHHGPQDDSGLHEAGGTPSGLGGDISSRGLAATAAGVLRPYVDARVTTTEREIIRVAIGLHSGSRNFVARSGVDANRLPTSYDGCSISKQSPISKLHAGDDVAADAGGLSFSLRVMRRWGPPSPSNLKRHLPELRSLHVCGCGDMWGRDEEAGVRHPGSRDARNAGCLAFFGPRPARVGG